MKTRLIPGRQSSELCREREQYVPRGVFNVTPIFMQEAHDATIIDVDGNSFIDFAGGLGVLNAGHTHPEIVEVIKAQAGKFLHGCFHVTMYESYVQMCRKMCEITPGDFPKKTMLSNSGAEAVENAVKIARCATGRKGIIVYEAGFHGRTHLTMTMTSKVRPYKFGFGSLASEIYRIPYPYCYRCTFGSKPESCGLVCMEFFKTFFAAYADPQEIAAIVIEPVIGEGGFIPAPLEYLRSLEKLCRDHQILLVADEVQTGFGRTGRFFAVEHSGVTPDLITSAKSMAAGLPLSAVTGKAEIMDAPVIGGLGGTFGGNPLSCTAALKVIDIMQRDGFLERARDLGDSIRERLLTIKERHTIVGDVRSLGPMACIELVKDRETKAPAKEETARIIKECYTRGLIILKAGVFDNVVRILVPLVVSDEQLHAGFEILEESLAAVR